MCSVFIVATSSDVYRIIGFKINRQQFPWKKQDFHSLGSIFYINQNQLACPIFHAVEVPEPDLLVLSE